MAERTLTISSAGKTFSVTGWKVGWVCGPAALLGQVRDGQAVPHLRRQRPVPVRDRRGLQLGRDRLSPRSPTTCGRRRDLLTTGLRELGFDVLSAAGDLLRHRRSRARCRPGGAGSCPTGPAWWRSRPGSSTTPTVDRYARFAFCKKPEVLSTHGRWPGWRGLSSMKVAAIQHDIVWEDGPATRARLTPLIDAGRRGRRAAGRADRDVRDRVLDEPDTHGRGRRAARTSSS